MASVNVPATWLAGGYLPPRCARHGTAETRRVKRTLYSNPPWWLIILAPLTLLLVLIVALVIRKTVVGALPACEACIDDRRRFLTRVWVGWGLSVVLLVVAVRLGPLVGLLWLLVQVAVLVETFRGDSYRVRGKVTPDGQWVELVGADELFAREIAHALATYQPAAQWPAPTSPGSVPPNVATHLAPPTTLPNIGHRSQTILPGS